MSHSHMDSMDGMSDMSSMSTTNSSISSTMTTPMHNMIAAFFTSTHTTLYSTAWTPSHTGTYALTCIFLMLLAVVLRGLLALRAYADRVWLDREFNRRYVSVKGEGRLREVMMSEKEEERADSKVDWTLSARGVEEGVVVVERRRGAAVRPWRMSVDPVRALIDVAIAAAGYLLMLAVMTMNVGYFLSILSGTFLGSLLLGRYTIITEH